jgi:hypothetical protein
MRIRIKSMRIRIPGLTVPNTSLSCLFAVFIIFKLFSMQTQQPCWRIARRQRFPPEDFVLWILSGTEFRYFCVCNCEPNVVLLLLELFLQIPCTVTYCPVEINRNLSKFVFRIRIRMCIRNYLYGSGSFHQQKKKKY